MGIYLTALTAFMMFLLTSKDTMGDPTSIENSNEEIQGKATEASLKEIDDKDSC